MNVVGGIKLIEDDGNYTSYRSADFNGKCL
jgi:hypothetical protein